MKSILFLSVLASLLPSSPHTTAIETEQGIITVTPLAGNSFNIVRTSPGEEAPYTPGGISLTTVRSWSDANTISFLADGYSVNVDKKSGQISFITSQGDTLLNETSPMHFRHSGQSAFYGAGERGKSLRLNGDTLVMWNRPNYGYGEGDRRINQMGITVPYIVSDEGYGLLFNDASRAKLALAPEVLTYMSENPKTFSYTFIGGGSLPEATSNFTQITGRQSLPPFWSLGYITSKYGYRSEKEALGAVDSLKTRGYPVDGIIFDLYWYGVETDMGRLEWSKSQFPNHKTMLDSLNRMGVKPVLIHQPYINKLGAIDNYNLLAADGLLTHDAEGNINDVHTWVGDAGMFDITNPRTREWLWNRLKGFTAEGLAGWWGDLGEPEQHPLSIRHANGMDAVDYHNRYGNDWSKLIYDGLRSDFPEMRPFLMMRGGTTGLQKYSVFPWTGDVSRSWQGLQPQIKLMLNSGLSGLGYMSSDIGGFAVDPKKPYDPELYLRWMQYGVFSPILRTHAQNQPEPYHYPMHEAALRDLVKMRYQWLPYNYTLAYENAADGQPLARPVNYYNTVNTDKDNITDEYLWGQEVLVAPVLTQGAKNRQVFFPDFGLSGNECPTWIYWFNPTMKYKGGTTATIATPLNEFPLFVKAGSFIPQYKQPIANVGEYDLSRLTVKYFPGINESSYVLFDDDRKNPESLEKGEYQLTHFTACPVKSGSKKGLRTASAKPGNSMTPVMEYIFTIESEGEYAGMPSERIISFEIVDISCPASVTIEGKNVPVSYDNATRTATFPVTYTYTPTQIIVKM